MSEENKAIVAVFDVAEGTTEEYDRIIKALEAAGAGNPKGRQYHVACPKGGGYLVVDVWESAELLAQFAETLAPIIQQVGGQSVEPQIYPVLNIIKG
jgi:hypothetical protein